MEYRSLWLVVWFASLWFPKIGFAQRSLTDSVTHQKIVEAIDAAIRYECERKQLPAFSIAVVQDGATLWSAGYGFQDTERRIPATSRSIYRVGSVSKLFTDLAIMQLVELGKLDLDDPVARHLTEFRPSVPEGFSVDLLSDLTIRQMMSHLSGLVREPPVGNYFDPTEPSLALTLDSLNQTELVYPPGKRTKYSNAAVAVVGAILEKYAGVSHPVYVRQSIFKPLSLQESGFEVDDAMRDQLVTGWMRADDGRDPFVAPDFLLGTGPAGNLYSSVDDLARFLIYLMSPQRSDWDGLPNEDVLEEMFAPALASDGRKTSFGLGFHLGNLDGHREVGHGGAVYGFSAQLTLLPDDDLGVVAVAAMDGVNGVVKRLTDYSLRVLLAHQQGKPLPHYRRTVAPDLARVEALVGDYLGAQESSVVEIRLRSGQMWLRSGSLHRKVRVDASSGEFVFDDEHGHGGVVKLFDGGIDLSGRLFQRIDPARIPALPPKRWSELIGEYGWDHNVLYIIERHGRLHALVEWFYCYPLDELGDDLFGFPDWGLYHGEKIRFVRDPEGDVHHAIAASVRFDRRHEGAVDGGSFKISPLEPIEALRVRAAQAKPPLEQQDFRPSDLQELINLDPSFRLDIRYATENNFMGSKFYEQARAFLQRPAANALVRVQKDLASHGLGLLIHDAYRPWSVTKMFWDATPGELKHFVANPTSGSRHNRGCAVDLTLFDFSSNEAVSMPSGYDEFSERSYAGYPGGSSRQRWYRERLRSAMEKEEFDVYRFEWWHFDHRDWQQYGLGNQAFADLDP